MTPKLEKLSSNVCSPPGLTNNPIAVSGEKNVPYPKANVAATNVPNIEPAIAPSHDFFGRDMGALIYVCQI